MTSPRSAHPLIADRYRLHRELGRGGMAVCHEVEDVSTGQRRALKRLLPVRGAEWDVVEALFEREYYNLVQLAHPSVVRVDDYGRDADGQLYYTMELLDGGDLRELAPMPWAELCKVLAHVCSALSLVHSRRLVHRDVTLRNIRCTLDGQAKLIDFGAVVPMGTALKLVGTPAYCAPEAVATQELDGRVDLFALGVTAYIGLTARQPYPARNFAELPAAWRQRPRPPSSYDAAIPAAVDQLLMSLLELDRAARPGNAAEVMERLCAIAGLDVAEQPVVRHAYLSTPTLVGRERELVRVRRLIAQAVRGKGATVLVSGRAGAGRSRLVSACVLEAKLAGATVLRLDAASGAGARFGASRVLVQQLLDSMPQLRESMAEDEGALLDALLQPADMQGAGSDRAAVQSMLRDLLVRASAERALVLAVDDLPQLDEPSMGLVALVADAAREAPILLVASADDAALDAPPAPLQLVANDAERLRIHGLSRDGTRSVLASVFGETPHVDILATHLHRVSGGLPGTFMHFAQHLLDADIIRYEAGAWTLPSELDADALPPSLQEALRREIAALPALARELVQTLAFLPDQLFGRDELQELSGTSDADQLYAAIDALASANLVRGQLGRYGLSSRSVADVILQDAEHAIPKRVHLRLADFHMRKDPLRFKIVEHYMQADEPLRALDHVVAMADVVQEKKLEDGEGFAAVIRALPANWVAICEQLIECCDQHGRPLRHRLAVHQRIAGYAAVVGEGYEHIIALGEQIRHDSGLDIYEELPADQEDRLARALQLAQERYDACPEHERGYPVGEAFRWLGGTVVLAIGAARAVEDATIVQQVPSLAPVVELSPALEVVHKNARSLVELQHGRREAARRGWVEAIARLKQPDGAGLPDVLSRYMSLAMKYAVGSLDVELARPEALRWADEIAEDPLFAVNAENLRASYMLRLGDHDAVLEHRRKADLLRAQHGSQHFSQGSELLADCIGYAAADDLVRLKQVVTALAKTAERFAGFQPALHLGKGYHHRVRGEYALALQEFEAGLEMASHRLAATVQRPLACAYVDMLRMTGRVEEAARQARSYLQQTLAEGADDTAALRQSLAMAESACGDHEAATEHAHTALEQLRAVTAGGVVLGAAFETCARVALGCRQQQRFDEYAARAGELYRAGKDSMLTGRYERLLRDGVAAEVSSLRPPDPNVRVVTAITECESQSERAALAIKALVQSCGAESGVLFGVREAGIERIASFGGRQPPDDLEAHVAQYVAAERSRDEELTMSITHAPQSELLTAWRVSEGQWRPVLLTDEEDVQRALVAVAVVYLGGDSRMIWPHSLIHTIGRALCEPGEAVGRDPAHENFGSG